MITQELVKELFEYQDGNLYRKTKIKQTNIGDLSGTFDSKGYRQTRINGVKILNHRIIFLMFHGFLPDYIDHIDGNPKNNKIENLRNVTQTQNCQNQKIPKNNTSGLKNVSWHKLQKKWQVRINVNGALKHFGFYHDIQVAKFIAETMRHKYHQQFSRNN